MHSLILLLALLPDGKLCAQARGGLKPEAASTKPVAVRNDVAQPGREVVTLRYFRIKKGTFDTFLKASQDDVWPFFEKIGARVIGMWKVVSPESVEGVAKPSSDYDEVYLSTRYASLEHWKATRDPVSLGGNGPDWQKCKRGLALRQSLTISSHVTFLEGASMAVKPYFMPGVVEAKQ